MRAEGVAALAPQIAGLARKLFARLYGNQDNRVSLQEVKHSGILRKLGQARSDAEEKEVFETADTNRDGVLSRGESFAFFNGIKIMSLEVFYKSYFQCFLVIAVNNNNWHSFQVCKLCCSPPSFSGDYFKATSLNLPNE